LRAFLLGLAMLGCTACGGGVPKASSADVLALHQPTPDPTLDAVVRDLPRALAGVAPTPTPTPKPTVVAVVRQRPAPPPAVQKPTAPKATSTPARH